MKLLLKLRLLTTIALWTCLGSWCGSNAQNLSNGGLNAKDSVLISYDELRIANSKMMELKYQKEINDSLTTIIDDYQKEIDLHTNVIQALWKERAEKNKEIERLDKLNTKLKTQVKIYKGLTIGGILVGVLGIIF